MRKLNFLLSIVVIAAATILTACAAKPAAPSQQIDNTKTVVQATVEPAAKLITNVQAPSSQVAIEVMGKNELAVTNFAVRLFKKSIDSEKNTLISPFSVLSALAMTANGAGGKTLSQMEALFGANIDETNNFLYAYKKSLPQGDNYKLKVANSLWLRDEKTFTIKQDFLKKTENWFGAGIYKEPFDNSTLRAINSWVNTNTDGMIPSILDIISPSAVMYLVNALAFDAEWQKLYEDSQVRKGLFTTESGQKRNIDLMYSQEGLYLQDKNAVGFIKFYKDESYAFAALLPDKGVTVADYAASLDGERLASLLAKPQSVKVQAAIPTFKCEYSIEMTKILRDLGMTDAFDSAKADFSAIGSSARGNIHISQVLHKTFIEVDKKGTKAAAATIIGMFATSAMPRQEEIKTVYLDRPFVYMLIDCKANIPIFIGILMDTNK